MVSPGLEFGAWGLVFGVLRLGCRAWDLGLPSQKGGGVIPEG